MLSRHKIDFFSCNQYIWPYFNVKYYYLYVSFSSNFNYDDFFFKRLEFDVQLQILNYVKFILFKQFKS